MLQSEHGKSVWMESSSLISILGAMASESFEAIASDYLHLKGHYYVMFVDRFSNWPQVAQIKPGSDASGAEGLIRALREVFAMFGVPEELSSDGGPEYSAKATEDFLKKWGVRHRQASAYHAQSNGRTKVTVKSGRLSASSSTM